MFLAVGHRGLRLLSNDGQTWTDQQLGREGEIYRAADFGNGRFVAIGSYGGDNIYASSTAGKTWQTGKKDARYSSYTRCVRFCKDSFVALGGDPGAVGNARAFALISSDGVTWSDPIPIPGKENLRRLAFGDGRYVAVGDRGSRAISTDGRAWQDVPGFRPLDTLIDVAFGKGVFVGVGLNGLRMKTVDGLAWTDRQLGEEGEHLNSILWADNRFLAVGAGATYTSPDGSTWMRHPNSDAPLTVAHGRGVFVGAHWKGRLLRSTDAITWHPVFKAGEHVEAVAFGGGD